MLIPAVSRVLFPCFLAEKTMDSSHASPFPEVFGGRVAAVAACGVLLAQSRKTKMVRAARGSREKKGEGKGWSMPPWSLV